MIVKISAKAEDRQSVLTITEIFHGKVVDVTHDSMVIEVTGHQDKLQSFLDMLGIMRFGIGKDRSYRSDQRY